MPSKSPEALARKKEYARRWRADNRQYAIDYWKENGKKYSKYGPRHKNYFNNNKLKVHARQLIYRALKADKLIKPINCERCNKRARLEADHSDYNKPLKVAWLCRPCHLLVTKQRLL